MRILTSLMILGLLGPALPRSAFAGNLRLTVVSAKIDGKKVAGSGSPMSTASLSDLACLSLPGLREVAGLCGGQDKGNRAPIDPFVRLEIGDRVIRTYPVPGTLTPKWEYGAVVDKAFLDGASSATVILYDLDASGDERKLGEAHLTAKDLTKPGPRTVKVGPADVQLRVEAVADGAAPRKYAFRVPADQQMADLARNAKTSGPGYVVIPVAEGEMVEVSASGKVQPSAKKHPDRVAGPNGIPTIQTKIQFNQPGFRGCPGCDHAALIGQIGTKGMVIGEHKQFTVDSSGLLVLAINDLKVSDNAGGFDVQVTVSVPPSSGGGARAMGKQKGSADDHSPSGLDPRVVQQIVDAHGEELDACAAAEANPYGDVVLAFSISADGSLLGVIVEKASPNLKKAGECMRAKALKWRFPPPHGIVSARYPISYSPG
jgi:hypothetical protein